MSSKAAVYGYTDSKRHFVTVRGHRLSPEGQHTLSGEVFKRGWPVGACPKKRAEVALELGLALLDALSVEQS